jgi:hypothetical protein
VIEGTGHLERGNPLNLQERGFNSSATRGERADHPEAVPRAREPQALPLRFSRAPSVPAPSVRAAARPHGLAFLSEPGGSIVSWFDGARMSAEVLT